MGIHIEWAFARNIMKITAVPEGHDVDGDPVPDYTPADVWENVINEPYGMVLDTGDDAIVIEGTEAEHRAFIARYQAALDKATSADTAPPEADADPSVTLRFPGCPPVKGVGPVVTARETGE